MSLAIAFPTKHGIIMSADRRLMTTIIDGEKRDTFLLTDAERKLFILPCGYGLSYTGTSSINGDPLSSILNTYLATFPSIPQDPKVILTKIASHIDELCSSTGVCVLIMCGYFEDVQFVYSINTQTSSFSEHHTENSTLLFSGESDVLVSLLNGVEHGYDYRKFNLSDAVAFLTFLNNTTATVQHFQQRPQTVSFDCDILSISPNSSQWVNLLSLPVKQM